MCPHEIAMHRAMWASGWQVEAARRRNSELGSEVAAGGVKLGQQRGCGPEANIGLLLRIVVERVDEDVFVAASLAGLGVCATKQVGAVGGLGVFRRRRRREGLRGWSLRQQR